MRYHATKFLQAVIIFIGISVFTLMIWLPLIEGKAEKSDLFNIYFDPFILYGYATSVVFFVALYKTFKLLGYIGQNKFFSINSIKSLRSIKYCTIILSIFIVMAGIYIRIFHHQEDDPVGFIAMSILIAFIFIVTSAAAAVFEYILQNGMDIKSEFEKLTSMKRNYFTEKHDNENNF